MKKLKIKNKKKFFIFFSVLLIIIASVLIVLTNFIISKNENKVSKAYEKSNNRSPQSKMESINNYEQNTNIDEETQKTYFQEIEELLNVLNIDLLYSKMNKIFLEKNSLNKDNFSEYVLKNGYVGNFPVVSSLTYAVQRDGSYVYRFKCYRDDRRVFYVNMIEIKPYEYTIDFSQTTIPTRDSKTYIYYNNEYDLDFEVTEIERTESGIAYQLKVTNNGEKEVEFYLNNVTDMVLEMEDQDTKKIDGYVKQASSVLSSRTYKLNKNSYFIKNMYFALDMQYHSKVKGMTFYNVRIEDINTNLRITF